MYEFGFYLCLALGASEYTLHPDLLFEYLGYDGVRDWQNYFYRNPFGFEIQNAMLGRMCAILANQWRKEGTEPATFEDFMFKFGREDPDAEAELVDEQPELTQEQIEENWERAFAARMGRKYVPKSERP